MTRDASNNPAYGAYGYIHHPDQFARRGRMVDYFKKHGISDSDDKTTPSESDVKAEIDAGYPVIASTKLTGSGHIVVIKGYTDDGYYIVNDPYGKDAIGNYDGANVLYTWNNMGVGSRYIVTAHATPSLSLDLIFAIDTTGSMWDDIDNVKASASSIVDEVLLDIPNARIAVVDYRDFPVDPYGGAGDYPFNDVLSFSTDKSAIVAAIQGLTLGWGNDWRESVYSALMHSIDSTSLGSWRGSDQAAKVIILMGDAPPHDPEPFTGYTVSSVATAAELADPVIIYPIQIGGTVEKFEELADQTGGKAFTAENAGDVVDAILDAIKEIKTKPVANANGPYTGYVGNPITFDGTGSYDLDGTIVSYEWDLDDDGEFDDASGPTPSQTWDTTYSGNISLKITDNDGATDIDTTTLTVAPPSLDPYVVSSDISGVERNTFDLSESVYCYAENLPPNDPAVDIYVVQNKEWSVGDSIGTDASGGVEIVSTDGSGNIGITLIWPAPLTSGNYDIVVDLNQDGFLNASESVDDMTLSEGVEAVPEFTTIAIPVATVLGLVFLMSRRRKYSGRNN